MFCVDEKTSVQALDRTAPLLPLRPGQPERRTHDYTRYGTTSLFAALDVATGKVIARCHPRHRAVEFRKFLATIDAQVPQTLDVHLILDNLSTHKAPTVQRWLAQHPRYHRSADAQDRVTTFGNASYGYRPSGELRFKAIGADTTWNHYSAMGALLDVRLPDGTVVGYTIDAEGRRVGKTVNGTIVKGWLYGDGLEVVAEVGPTKSGTNNDVVSRFVFGASVGVPEYMERAGTTYRMIADERGSIRLVVNATTGAVMQQIDYDPFGRVMLNTNPGFQPFGFASGIYDEQTGLVRFGARDYDPEVGRWTTKDPIGFNGKSLNLYQYASNDPLNHTDRTGLVGELSEQEAGMAVGAVIATALMARFIQQRQQTESVFGPLTLSYDFKRNWQSALEPSDLPRGTTPPPPKGSRHMECESYCNDSMEEKQTWCNGPRGPKFAFQRASCNSAAATGTESMAGILRLCLG